MLGRQTPDSDDKRQVAPTLQLAGDAPHGRLISAQLAALRSSLLEQGQQLAQVVDGPARMLVDDALGVLAKQVCRIAVIGQVKAGKSTFVNALVRQPGLLPTHVNPWTTAITHLHFWHAPAPDGNVARFTFFNRDEWQNLGAGKGRLRELTEQLVPGFEPDLLMRNLKSMRARAEKRHGKQLDELLGTSHSFPTVEPSLLDKYVCAGEEGQIAAATPPGAGQYSDIIKLADLHLSGGPFQFPTTVVDTPGFNDPFLIRDEISRQSLDSADVYIVVLSALQPLSKADVALFRLLRGLHKERIVVFINRVDQLARLQDDLAAVKLQVRNGLRREFPDVDVPIVAGSALWAAESLAIERGNDGQSLANAHETFRKHEGLQVFREALAVSRQGSLSAAETSRVLFTASAMNELGAMLDQVVNRSHPAHVIGHIGASFAELAHFGEMSCQHELQRIETSLSELNHASDAHRGELEKLQGDVLRVQDLTRSLVNAFNEFDARLQDIFKPELEWLTSALRDVVREFAEKECARLGEAAHRGERDRSWQTDAAALRKLLEQRFNERMAEVSTKLSEVDAQVLPLIREIVSRVLPESLQSLEPSLRPVPVAPASLAALSRPVVFDLGLPWWKAWWLTPLSAHERSQALDRAIRTQFFPVADELARSAIRQLREQIAKTHKEAEATCLSVIHSLRRQSEWNIARLQDLELTQAQLGDAGRSEPLLARLAQVRNELAGWHKLNEQLRGLSRVSEQLLA